ncbi:MAG: GIY-YIG nuclease family protein [Saprospiraceae bacterium]|nr:GIY-YIG nuclease family protein [Lewinellaceae bacterium]
MHFVYILYSESSDMYYVGQTPDMETRMLFHNELGTGFTSNHRPWALMKSYDVGNSSLAHRVEKYIKKKKSRVFIKKLIYDDTLWEYVIEKCSAG